MSEKEILELIENKIYLIRGQKVMLDNDLAKLYGIPTKRLNEQVRRNISRFPEDFMFILNKDEFTNLRSQFATSSSNYGGRRSQPLVFTENGIAMLSSVLNSEVAIQVNIAIMRTFTKLRSYLSMQNQLNEKVDKLEENTTKVFQVVFERLDTIEEKLIPSHPDKRKKIGLKNKLES